jgi:ActR/RegA family two-component response regulator
MAEHDVEAFFHVGRAVVLHSLRTLGEEGRVRTFMRGWQRGAYLLLDVPRNVGHAANLRVDEICVLRFLADGDACGCNSVIEDLGTGSHFSFVRVRWPETVSCVRVRKHERVHLHAPCDVILDNDRTIQGELLDISAGGCKIGLPHTLPKNDRVSLSFMLPDGSDIKDLTAIVCASAEGTEGAWVGCEYHDPDGPTLYDIEFFVATTIARLRAERPGPNQVLIMEPDAGKVNDLRIGLKSAGYEVTLAPGPVDGFFWLRLATPSILIAAADQQVINGADVVKIVKSTRQFRNLPIIVYGGSADIGKRAIEAGASSHVASAGDVQKITAAVQKLTQQLTNGSGTSSPDLSHEHAVS